MIDYVSNTLLPLNYLRLSFTLLKHLMCKLKEITLKYYNDFALDMWYEQLDEYDELIINWNKDFKNWLIWKLAHIQDVLKWWDIADERVQSQIH